MASPLVGRWTLGVGRCFLTLDIGQEERKNAWRCFFQWPKSNVQHRGPLPVQCPAPSVQRHGLHCPKSSAQSPIHGAKRHFMRRRRVSYRRQAMFHAAKPPIGARVACPTPNAQRPTSRAPMSCPMSLSAEFSQKRRSVSGASKNRGFFH